MIPLTYLKRNVSEDSVEVFKNELLNVPYSEYNKCYDRFIRTKNCVKCMENYFKATFINLNIVVFFYSEIFTSTLVKIVYFMNAWKKDSVVPLVRLLLSSNK